jgi:hypothetical protein
MVKQQYLLQCPGRYIFYLIGDNMKLVTLDAIESFKELLMIERMLTKSKAQLQKKLKDIPQEDMEIYVQVTQDLAEAEK